MSACRTALLALALLPAALSAQGVTTAAVQGRVLTDDRSPVPDATVVLTHVASGRRWTTVTRADGRYLLDAVAVGVHRADVRAVGFVPQSRTDVALVLGQRAVMEFTLRPLTVELPPVTVRGRRDPVLDPGRTGPADVIERATIAELPNLGRTFFGLALQSPQAALSVRTPAIATATGLSFDGQNRVYNSFQIDGGKNHDAYRGQLPGRESLPRPISLEAIEEVQVLTAPFDVRQGGFAGGLVNAVTRTGTNTFHGSLFAFLTDAALARSGGVGGDVEDFTTWQYGGSVGGPIVRDRAHFFASVDVQHRVVPDPGPLITDTAAGADTANIGISYESAERFRTLLDTLYGLDPGTLGPVQGRVPAVDVFGKLTVQLATNSHLTASYQFGYGNRQDFLLRSRNYYAVSTFAQSEPSTLHSVRVNWNSLPGGRWSNDLSMGFLALGDECRPSATYPEIRVTANPSTRGFLNAGTAGGCQPGAALRQEVLELTDHASIGLGSHVVGVGVHGELLRLRDNVVNVSPGLWSFANLNRFESRAATRYQRTLRGPAWNGGVDFRAWQLALYAQDRWNPTRALAVTAGLRLDVPILPDAIPTNDSLLAALGADTGRLPGGNVSWSPRLGVNYDADGEGRTYVRGGIGLFSGTAPYRWLSNAYRDDGTQELFLDCRGAHPPPAFDPRSQPDTCADGWRPYPRLSFFAPGTRPPQNLKAALGVDRRLSRWLVGTVDVLYTRAVRQLYVTDANLSPPIGVARGEGNRAMYGTISANADTITTARLDPAYDQVIRVSNSSGDKALSVTVQLRTRLGGALEGSALYAYTRAQDRMSIAHIQARAMLEGTVLEGTHEARRLGTSLFEIPHRVQVMATVRLPYRASLALVYAGSSGRPFTYTVGGRFGDANADGLGTGLRQDPAYVPRHQWDVSIDGNGPDAAGFGNAYQQDSVATLLDDFINAVPCLRAQRGRIMARNSCRNPWFGTVNARLTKSFTTFGARTLELTADVYNVLNLVNAKWGLSRYDGLTFGTDLVQLTGYDAAAGRGIYAFSPPPRGQLDDLASRWQMELSVRYVF